MTRTLFRAAVLVTFAAAVLANEQSREQKLQQAIDLIESRGDPARAVPLLEEVAKSTDRMLAARALLYLGQAQERRDGERARRTYERIIREFGAQADVVAQARARLAALGGAAAGPPPGLLTERLIESRADEFYGLTTISLDGHWMTMADPNGGEISVRNLTTAVVTRVALKSGSADNGWRASSPIYSPARRQIAYQWHSSQGRAQLRTIGTDAGSAPAVLVDKADYLEIEPVAWFPDGTSMLVEITTQDRHRTLSRFTIADRALAPIKSLAWRMFQTGSAALSPDGRYIAYAALAQNPSRYPPAADDARDQHVYLVSADGTREAAVVRSSGRNAAPVWTSDGAHLLFISDRSGTSDLWRLAVRDGDAAGPPVAIKRDLGKAPDPIGMTAAGAYYYERNQPDGEHLWIAGLNGAGRAPESNTRGSLGGYIGMWSPDGASIAFNRMRAAPSNQPLAGPNVDWVIQSLGTGEERTLPRPASGGVGPGIPPPTKGLVLRWFNDSSRVLAMVTHEDGSFDWHAVDTASGIFSSIAPAGALQRMPTAVVSRDNSTLYAAARHRAETPAMRLDRIIAVDVATGRERLVAMLPGNGDSWPWTNQMSLAVSPDGGTLAIAAFNPLAKEIAVSRMAIDGTGLHEIHRGSAAFVGPHQLEWTRDGRSLIFAKNTGATAWRLMRLPAEGGTPAFTGLEGRGNVAFNLSPDGRRIVISTTGSSVQELRSIEHLPVAIKASR